MTKPRIYTMSFARVYPEYVAKAERKGRTKAEVDTIICWLTGYSQKELQTQLDKQIDIETFYAEAPRPNPSRSLITGVICGVRVEDIEDPTMQAIRYLDKLIDELAKGKAMEKILRKKPVRTAFSIADAGGDISGGAVHKVPADLREALTSDPEALAAWEDLTALARNEWICWAISVQKPETRKQHVERVRTELKEGMRRPCCWYGCVHRTDKPVSPSVQHIVLNKQRRDTRKNPQ